MRKYTMATAMLMAAVTVGAVACDRSSAAPEDAQNGRTPTGTMGEQGSREGVQAASDDRVRAADTNASGTTSTGGTSGMAGAGGATAGGTMGSAGAVGRGGTAASGAR